MSICLREATRAPVTAKTATPNRSSMPVHVAIIANQLPILGAAGAFRRPQSVIQSPRAPRLCPFALSNENRKAKRKAFRFMMSRSFWVFVRSPSPLVFALARAGAYESGACRRRENSRSARISGSPPPPGMVASDAFPGFEDRERKAGSSSRIARAAYEQFLKSMNSGAIEVPGVAQCQSAKSC